jgi:hypothetical protein
MPMCKRPGCVSQAPSGELCPIHAAGAGKLCQRCYGEGQMTLTDKQGNTYGKCCCDRCGGTGLLDQKTSAARRRADDDPIEQRGLIKIANE